MFRLPKSVAKLAFEIPEILFKAGIPGFSETPKEGRWARVWVSSPSKGPRFTVTHEVDVHEMGSSQGDRWRWVK